MKTMKTTINGTSQLILSRAYPFVIIHGGYSYVVQTIEEAMDAVRRAPKSGYRRVCGFVETATDTVFSPDGEKTYDASEFFGAWRAVAEANDHNARVDRFQQAIKDFPDAIQGKVVMPEKVPVPTPQFSRTLNIGW